MVIGYTLIISWKYSFWFCKDACEILVKGKSGDGEKSV